MLACRQRPYTEEHWWSGTLAGPEEQANETAAGSAVQIAAAVEQQDVTNTRTERPLQQKLKIDIAGYAHTCEAASYETRDSAALAVVENDDDN